MNWLPKHECGLTLEHNAHKDVYETIDNYYQFLNDEDWVSKEERERAIALDSVWTLQWYPDTPVGFYKIAASSLEALKVRIESGDWE